MVCMYSDTLCVRHSRHDCRPSWYDLIISATCQGRIQENYHYCLTEAYGRLVYFVSKDGHKIAADLSILSKLLLEPFRVWSKMLQNAAFYSHNKFGHVQHDLREFDAITALVRCTHENYAVRRKSDGSVAFQGAFSCVIGVNESLFPVNSDDSYDRADLRFSQRFLQGYGR